MTSSYTTNKGIEKPAYQDYASDPTGWTVPVNNDWDIIDNAFGGTHSISLTNVDVTLTPTQCQNVRIYLSGSLSGNVIINFPSTISGFFLVADGTTRNGYTITLRNAGGGLETKQAVNLAYTFIWVDQATAGVYLADNSPVTGGTGINVSGATINLQTPVAVANGGTGATTYTAGQLLIGNNAGGLTPATLTQGSNIQITNGNGAITISATGSAGGVTTFSAGTTGFTPNTNTAGAVTLAGTLGVANGGTGAATLTGYVKGSGTSAMTASATIPTSDLTGTLGVANGGTGAATLTGYVKGSGTSAMTASASIPGSDVTGSYTGSAMTLATSRLLGRTTAGTGAVEEISAGTGISLSGGSLAVASSGVSAGTYTNATVTVDATGRVTSASSGSSGAVSSVSASSSASGFGLSASPTTGAVSVSFSVSSASNARSTLGLGDMATQSASSVSITGGSIGGSTSISTSATGSFGAVRVNSSGFDILGYSAGVASVTFGTGNSLFTSGTGIEHYASGTPNFATSNTYFRLQSGITPQAYGTTTWTNISDARTKKEELPYTKGLVDLSTLNVVSYKYNGSYGTPDNNVRYYGLIAQEVLTSAFPDMVGTYTYTDPQTKQQTQLYSVDTSQLVFSLINAVRELSNRVAALEAKVP